MILTTTVLYSLSLLQASHRVDQAHLLQAIPLAFILMAWLASKLSMNISIISTSGFRRAILYMIFLALCTGAILPVLLVNESGWPKIDVRGVPEKLREYSLSKDRMLATIEKESNAWYPEMMNYIRRCTNNNQRLMALPALTTFYYFTGRMFGGGQIVIISGYFVSNEDQIDTVSKMSQQDIPLIIYLPNSMTDNKEERRFEVIAPIIASYIYSNYAKITQIDDAMLLLRRDLKLEDQSGSLREFSCPVYKE